MHTCIYPALAQLEEHLTVVVRQPKISNGRWFDSSKPDRASIAQLVRARP